MPGEFSTLLVCLNGHEVTWNVKEYPEMRSEHCVTCGEHTIEVCPDCEKPIRGSFYFPSGSSTDNELPKFCHACGKPYPWTQRSIESLRSVLNLMVELTPGQRADLDKSISDLINDTPRSEVAALQWKRALAVAKGIPVKILAGVIEKACTNKVCEFLIGP